MVENIIPFSKPYFPDEDLNEIAEGIKAVLKSGWLTSGPNVQKFEENFATSVGSSYGVALNSCTAALHAILLGLGLKSGDEVIVPTNTFVTTANAPLYVGAKPVFADSDPLSFNISPEDIQDRISNKTRAIIAVHLGGNPCEMKEITEIAHDYNIIVVEDCAHAHGSKYGEICCGNLGVAGAFSFYPTKVITSAEGGIVTTDDKVLADKLRIIRNCGRAGYGPLAISNLGFNYRLSDLHAIVGLSQLKHLAEFVKQRNFIAKRYDLLFSNIESAVPQMITNGSHSSYYAYVVKLTEQAPFSRDELMSKLKDKGVLTSVLYHPVHQQPYYQDLFNGNLPDLPFAEDLGRNSLALPLYNGMSLESVDYVIDVLASIFH